MAKCQYDPKLIFSPHKYSILLASRNAEIYADLIHLNGLKNVFAQKYDLTVYDMQHMIRTQNLQIKRRY
jgi:hypothetical protein